MALTVYMLPESDAIPYKVLDRATSLYLTRVLNMGEVEFLRGLYQIIRYNDTFLHILKFPKNACPSLVSFFSWTLGTHICNSIFRSSSLLNAVCKYYHRFSMTCMLLIIVVMVDDNKVSSIQ